VVSDSLTSTHMARFGGMNKAMTEISHLLVGPFGDIHHNVETTITHTW
jgi:hypothetical protein